MMFTALDELVSAWSPIVDELEGLSTQYNKPIMFNGVQAFIHVNRVCNLFRIIAFTNRDWLYCKDGLQHQPGWVQQCVPCVVQVLCCQSYDLMLCRLCTVQ
jgi:hypothetical protein